VNARIAALIFTLITGARAAQRPPLTTVMYMTNRPTAIASFLEHWNGVSIIAPQCFAMDAQGFVAGEVPPAVLETARQHRIAIMPLVTNKGFNQPLVHSVLDSPEARARAIRYLIYYALRDGYIGIQFDYENIKYTYRDRFSDFFHQAAVEFHKRGLLLTAAVVGKYSDDRNAESPGGYDDWSGVYDYPRLARDADFLSIMAYPQHGAFSSPGPLAGLPWVRQIVAFTRSQMPLGKISLGVPLYGFHWVTDPSAKRTGRSSVYKDTAAILAQNRAEWREEEQAYRTVFDDSAGRHEVWYEDARSVGAKLQLAASERLAGISAWALGQEDPGVWEALARDYRIVRPRTRIPKGTFAERSKGAARRL
jgi:spore germination protein YaaH